MEEEIKVKLSQEALLKGFSSHHSPLSTHQESIEAVFIQALQNREKSSLLDKLRSVVHRLPSVVMVSLSNHRPSSVIRGLSSVVCGLIFHFQLSISNSHAFL